MTTTSNDVRSRTLLKHDSIGTVEFAWDEGDWVIVSFKSTKSVPYWLTCGYTLTHDEATGVPKQKARDMWAVFTREGWTEQS